MDVVLKIIGFLGGGWGTAAAAVGAIVLFFLIKGAWKNYQEGKSDKDSKDQFDKDHEEHINSGSQAEGQANGAGTDADAWANAQKPKP